MASLSILCCTTPHCINKGRTLRSCWRLQNSFMYINRNIVELQRAFCEIEQRSGKNYVVQRSMCVHNHVRAWPSPQCGELGLPCAVWNLSNFILSVLQKVCRPIFCKSCPLTQSKLAGCILLFLMQSWRFTSMICEGLGCILQVTDVKKSTCIQMTSPSTIRWCLHGWFLWLQTSWYCFWLIFELDDCVDLQQKRQVHLVTVARR